MAGLLGSSTVRRLLFPDLTVVLAASSGVVWLNTMVLTTPIEAPVLPFTLTATALSLLLAFRINYSNHRFEEARGAWQSVVTSARSLLRVSSVHIAPRSPEAHVALTGLVRAFPRCMVFWVCPDGDLVYPDGDTDVVAAEAGHELRAQLEDVLPYYPAAVDRITAASDAPLEVVQMLTELVAAIEADIPDRVVGQLNVLVDRLEEAHSVSERVLNTPIPTNYTRHTSRFLCMWNVVLPLALWPGCGVYTVPVSLGVSLALLAIEDIGVVIEEPFDLLPMWSYVDQCDGAAAAAATAAAAVYSSATADSATESPATARGP
jgi:putative membrane protein